MNKQQALDRMEQKREVFIELSDKIWDHPETAFQEYFAVEEQIKILEKEDFQIVKGVADMETAFTASFGQGRPVIGILGEYDALSSLSQKADLPRKEPVVRGGNGHGCGHNLLGAGSLAAAVAVKEYLKENRCSGTIIYYGCPGEEGGSGKAFLARAGLFQDLDGALTWHPGDMNAGSSTRCLANFKVHYRFQGRASHAASSPHLGRSALDGLELMNIGIQFLREHMIPEARIHYAIVNTGGVSPNVVQSEAEAVYYIRAPRLEQTRELKEWVDNVAKGAALMSGTEVESKLLTSCANIVPNDVLAQVMMKNLEEVPLPVYTEEERAYAASFCETLEQSASRKDDVARRMGEQGAGYANSLEQKVINDFVMPDFHENIMLFSSSDVGDVSWNCPTTQIMAVTMAAGTPGHSWQRTAQGKSSIAHKGMLYAGKVIAGSAIDLLEHPEILEKAKKELDKRLDGSTYSCDIPEDVKPDKILV